LLFQFIRGRFGKGPAEVVGSDAMESTTAIPFDEVPLVPITWPKTVKGPPSFVPSSSEELSVKLMNQALVALSGPVERAMATVPLVFEIPASLGMVPKFVRDVYIKEGLMSYPPVWIINPGTER